MATIETNPQLGQQVVDDAKQYVLHSWSVQDALNPIPVAGAEGRYFWDFEGKRYLDFASQLVNVSIGHQHPKLVAAVSLETVTGTNGIIVPPDGYLQSIRDVCDKHGILLIADEVMAGFGRTGKWFGVDNWDVVPDMITMAKGINSGYIPLGALAIREHLASGIRDKYFAG